MFYLIRCDVSAHIIVRRNYCLQFRRPLPWNFPMALLLPQEVEISMETILIIVLLILLLGGGGGWYGRGRWYGRRPL